MLEPQEIHAVSHEFMESIHQTLAYSTLRGVDLLDAVKYIAEQWRQEVARMERDASDEDDTENDELLAADEAYEVAYDQGLVWKRWRTAAGGQ